MSTYKKSRSYMTATVRLNFTPIILLNMQVQNCAARLINLNHHDHITPCLIPSSNYIGYQFERVCNTNSVH